MRIARERSRAPLWIAGGVLIGALVFWLGHQLGFAEGQRSGLELASNVSRPIHVPAVGANPSAPIAPPAPPAAPGTGAREPSAPSSPSRSRKLANSRHDTRASALASAPPSPERPRRGAASSASGTASAGEAEPSTLTFREVLEQLRRAQLRLRDGQATMSLLLLSELDRNAGEILREERETTRVLALCAAGREAAAREAAALITSENPRSIYSMRLSDSCVARHPDE